MSDPIKEISNLLDTAKSLYHRLVLLVGEAGSGKTVILNEFCNENSLKLINLNLELSRCLLDLSPRQRIIQLTNLLDQIIKTDSDTIVLDNLEILFEVELKQEPMKVLQRISRNRNLLVAWPGRITENKLIYAEHGHTEYRSHETDDLIIVEL